jgi:uncharacterized membrane protein YcaP (DUF421 family)
MIEVAGRAAVIYALMLVAMRVMGKRTVGNLTAFDMLIALMLGDLAGDAIYGDASLGQATVAILALGGLHYGNSWLAYLQPGIGRWIEGSPTAIVKHGQFLRRGLRRERMSEQEVLAELRLDGLEEIADVRLAQVENDGQVSVIREEPAEPLLRRDLGSLQPPGTERTRPGRV